ncbi:unnamed protein product [Musa textilis]
MEEDRRLGPGRAALGQHRAVRHRRLDPTGPHHRRLHRAQLGTPHLPQHLLLRLRNQEDEQDVWAHGSLRRFGHPPTALPSGAADVPVAVPPRRSIVVALQRLQRRRLGRQRWSSQHDLHDSSSPSRRAPEPSCCG